MKTFLTLKSALALLLATAFVLSTGVVMAVAGEEEGAGGAGSYAVESSESTGLPDMTEAAAQDPAIANHDPDPRGEILKGEEEGAGREGKFEVQSSESTGLPDVTLFEIK